MVGVAELAKCAEGLHEALYGEEVVEGAEMGGNFRADEDAQRGGRMSARAMVTSGKASGDAVPSAGMVSCSR